MSADVKAPHGGIVREVLVAVADEVKQEQPIFTVERHATSDEWTQERQWAFEVRQRQMREAQEAELNWQRWQRRWQQEQKRRWEEWQQRRTEQPWWRRQQAHWQRHWQEQHQQQQRQQRRRAEAPRAPRSASKSAERLPSGDVKRMLLARDHYDACARRGPTEERSQPVPTALLRVACLAACMCRRRQARRRSSRPSGGSRFASTPTRTRALTTPTRPMAPQRAQQGQRRGQKPCTRPLRASRRRTLCCPTRAGDVTMIETWGGECSHNILCSEPMRLRPKQPCISNAMWYVGGRAPPAACRDA